MPIASEARGTHIVAHVDVASALASPDIRAVIERVVIRQFDGAMFRHA
jgi:hypothetical protein